MFGISLGAGPVRVYVYTTHHPRRAYRVRRRGWAAVPWWAWPCVLPLVLVCGACYAVYVWPVVALVRRLRH
jgi:hypothetical protein